MMRYPEARDFIKARLAQNDTRPALRGALEVILERAERYQDERYPDYSGGYATALEEVVIDLAAIWRHHPDYPKVDQ